MAQSVTVTVTTSSAEIFISGVSSGTSNASASSTLYTVPAGKKLTLKCYNCLPRGSSGKLVAATYNIGNCYIPATLVIPAGMEFAPHYSSGAALFSGYLEDA